MVAVEYIYSVRFIKRGIMTDERIANIIREETQGGYLQNWAENAVLLNKEQQIDHFYQIAKRIKKELGYTRQPSQDKVEAVRCIVNKEPALDGWILWVAGVGQVGFYEKEKDANKYCKEVNEVIAKCEAHYGAEIDKAFSPEVKE